jgi:predicted GTPase
MSAVDPIRDRIETLSQINELGGGLVSEQTLERSRALVDRSSVRLEHGTSHTVVALAGATGSGKSSLFNAIAGAQIARSGVRRLAGAKSPHPSRSRAGGSGPVGSPRP